MKREPGSIQWHVAVSRFDDRNVPVVFTSNSFVDPDWDDIPNHQLLTGESLDYLFIERNPSEAHALLSL